MEITYDLIIKYLSKKNTNTFITQKNIYTYANTFPDKFKNLLTEKFFKCGITVYNNDINISFWTSVLTILDKKFIVSMSDDEIEYINQFKNQLIEKYKKSHISSFLKEFDKTDLREMFKLVPNNNVIQYLVDIMDINIIIFDFKNEKILSYYKGEKMNPWKQSLLLAQSNDFFEPIMCIKSKGDIDRLFDFNNIIFKKIIVSETIETFNKEFSYYDSINDIVTIEKSKLKINDDLLINDSDSVYTDEIFINNDIYDEIKSMSKYKMSKMKVNELLELTKKINIVITNKPTKALLIEMIQNKVNNINL